MTDRDPAHRFPLTAPRTKAGAPFRTKYDDGVLVLARELAERGSAGQVYVFELAQLVGVSVGTIWRWCLRHPDFRDIVEAAEADPIDATEVSLFQRAHGYSYQAEQVNIVKVRVDSGERTELGKIIYEDKIETVRTTYIEHVPPDVSAQKFILTNARNLKWKDRQQVEHTGKDGAPLQITISREDAAVATGAIIDVPEVPDP